MALEVLHYLEALRPQVRGSVALTVVGSHVVTSRG
jgi:hypothetical protein